MKQPLPKNIKEKVGEPIFNTMLIDGSNILEVCSHADNTLSSRGTPIGGVFQFLLQIKLLLQKGNFKYIYVFWDGDNSGELRYRLYPDYKKDRDKTFNTTAYEELSEYGKSVEDNIKRIQDYVFNKKKKKEKYRSHKDTFFWQRDVVMKCLEELFVRQCLCDRVEADDLIGYYIANKKENERVVIVSNDKDLTQLIDEDVIIYSQSRKKFINTKNCQEIFGIHHKNILLKKILCGDSSDSIKGIKGLGEQTLHTNYPELLTEEIDIEFIKERARQINEERKTEKKKPLKWCENILNGVSDGNHKGDFYEINNKIINLKEPLMTQESIEMMGNLMYNKLDPTDRNMQNLYTIIKEYNIEPLYDYNKFSSFFSEFSYYSHREINHE